MHKTIYDLCSSRLQPGGCQPVNTSAERSNKGMAFICMALAAAVMLPLASIDKVYAETNPRRVIMDHDGNFEDYYAIFAAALASKRELPKIKLTAVLVGPTGEGYCQNSNGYPDQHAGTIVDMTEKALALAEYEADVVSGCDEQTTTVKVVDRDPTSPTVGQKIKFRVQEPMGGIGQCRHHREFGFQPWALQCYYEFSGLWRQDTLKLPPIADVILKSELNTTYSQPKPAIDKPASVYLAEAMCAATEEDPLTVLEVGPATTVGRALQKIQKSPRTYGCKEAEQILDAVEVRFMGGAWDTNPADNFDPITQEYRLADLHSPDYTAGNIYYDPSTALYAFGSPHVPDGVYSAAGGVDENSGFFNALNNAEWNFYVDAVAVDVVLRSGLPVAIGATNATDHAPLKGFGDRLDAAFKDGSCSSMPARFIRDSMQVLPAADDLQWWDSLITMSLVEDFVDYRVIDNVRITTPFSGDPNTGGPEVWARDSGKLFAVQAEDDGDGDYEDFAADGKDKHKHKNKYKKRDRNYSGRPVMMGVGVITNDGVSFKEMFDDYMFGLLCN